MFEYLFGRGQIVPLLAIAVALVATLIAQMRTLPVQNVLAAGALIYGISTVIQTIGEKLGFPFGPFFYTENLGPTLLYLVPWPVPMIWLIAIFNSRGVARLILRPWRDLPNYGFASLALTCVLTVVFDFNLEPYAARTEHFWIWKTQKPFLAWYGAPLVNFAAWAAVTLLLVAIVTPWLIIKKPMTNPPPDYPPLVLWLITTLLLTTANAAHQHWAAVVFGLVTITAITILAFRNSRR
jgi:putative membrane protein